MTIKVDVHHTRRFHLVRFLRAINGNPDVKYPEPDDRGYLTPEFGPAVGVLAGSTVTVLLKRLSLDNAAPLFVKSNDPATFTVHTPRGGKLPSGEKMEIEITGVTGGNPKKAKLEVHFQSLTGPIIHELTVWVLQPLRIAITPHLVTIGQAGVAGAGTPSVANMAAIMPLVSAIWAHHGVTFTVGAVQNEAVSFAAAGFAHWDDEIKTLLNTRWVPGSINVYLVNALSGLGSGTLGIGLSRTIISTYAMPNPGILLADTAGSITRDTMWWANDLAHEIGHFFNLWHPEDPPPWAGPARPILQDTWSRRQLMHNNNHMLPHTNWKDNVGYGNLNRGCFISMKHLSQLTTDNEDTTARGTIGSSAGPY